MAGPNPTLTKTFTAGAAVAARRIVKHGSGDTLVVQATATAGDALLGVSAELAAASGARVDIHLAGIAEVEYGASVTRGAQLKADADGKAVAAAPGAGVNNRVIGVAMVSGASGDIGLVLLAPSMLQG